MSAQPRLAWALLAQAIRSSPVPFLYQTRTLTAPSRRHVLRFHQPCSLYTTTTNNSSQSYDSSPSQAEQESATENGESREADGENTDIESSSASSSPPSKPARQPRRSYLLRRGISATQRDHAPRERPAGSPVMTMGEKQVLGKLFEQLGIDNDQIPVEPAAPKKRESPLKDEDRREMAHISAIFDSVVQEMRKMQQTRAEASPLDGGCVAEAANHGKMPTRHRQRLHNDQELTDLLNTSKITPSQAIDMVIRREATKIEAALRASVQSGKGEAGIWEVCRERIFSMMQHLGDNQKTASVLNGIELPGHSSSEEQSDAPASKTTKTTTTTCGPLEVPSCVPIEAVVTALYPKMLLVAFRLLNLHFPESSLIGQFRSTISALGRESALLGSSTALYNELIYFYWRGCHDVPGVVSLLHEMEVTGVEPDARTCGILSAIVRQREQDLIHNWRRTRPEKRGSIREPWWDLPSNRKAMRELMGENGWIQRLEERIKERKERERLYG